MDSPPREKHVNEHGSGKPKGLVRHTKNDETQNSGKNGLMSAKSFYGTSLSPPRSPLFNSSPFQVNKKVQSCKIGLPNAGLTCYLNAVFQCFLNHPSFACDLSTTWEQISKSPLQEKMLIKSFCQLLKKKQDGQQKEVCDIMQSQIHKNKILRQLSGEIFFFQNDLVSIEY